MTPDQIAFAEKFIRNGNFPSEIAGRINRKFKTTITKEMVSGMMQNGELTDNRRRVVTDDEIRRLLDDNVSANQIRRMLGVGFYRIDRVKDGRPAKPEAKPRKPRRQRDVPTVPKDDPVSAIGVHFNDLEDNACRYAVARDPDDNQFRFCGRSQMIRGRDRFGKVLRSSYCVEHHCVCYRSDS